MSEVDFELIKKRRVEMRFTLKEMADATGINGAPSYYKYEKGVYKFKAHHLPLLASKLKLKMKDIFLIA